MSRFRPFLAGLLLLAATPIALGQHAVGANVESPPPSSGANGSDMSAPFAPALCRHCGGDTMSFAGWNLAGTAPQEYQTGYEEVAVESAMVGTFFSKPAAQGAGFGTIMQTITAKHYTGQRVRFSARLRASDVEQGAGLWMRVDAADNKVLAFDNMRSRPLVGTLDWRRYDVVLDVASDAKYIAYGVLLIGKGRVAVNDVRFEKVGQDVATTDVPRPHVEPPDAPVNLELKPVSQR